MNNIIAPGRKFGSILPFAPQTMTVQYVSDTEVHFTRKGVSGIFIMPIEHFCEIGVVLDDDTKTAATRQYGRVAERF